MDDDILDKVMDRYGVVGLTIVIISGLGILFAWIILSLIYPIFFAFPILLAIWMVWSVTKDNKK